MAAIGQYLEDPAADVAELTEEEQRASFLEEIGVGQSFIEGLGPARSGGPDLDVALDQILERMADRAREIKETNEIADRRIANIEGWRRQMNESAEREIRWLELHFEAVAQGYDFGRKKSRSLPNGSFGYRRKNDTIEIVDMDAAVNFAESKGLEIKKSVNKTPLMKYVKATGEIPDGTALIDGGDEFFVRPLV